jgi:hypothetical protein
MDDYWRTLLAEITEQDGATLTYKAYTEFHTIFSKSTDFASTYDIVKRYARTYTITARTSRDIARTK